MKHIHTDEIEGRAIAMLRDAELLLRSWRKQLGGVEHDALRSEIDPYLRGLTAFIDELGTPR